MDAVRKNPMMNKIGKNWFQMTKKEPPKTYGDLLKDMAESSSLHGIGKVVSTRQLAVKVLWLLLLLGTMGVFAMQLRELFITFYSNPVKTTVSLSFSPLKYPAITFCNMNAIKLSLLNQSEPIDTLLRKARRRKKREVRTESDKLTEADMKRAFKVEPVLESRVQPVGVNTWNAELGKHEEHLQKIRDIWPNKVDTARPETASMYDDTSRGNSGDNAHVRVRRDASETVSITPSSTVMMPSYSDDTSFYANEYESDYWPGFGNNDYYYDYGFDLSIESQTFFQEQLSSLKNEWEEDNSKFRVLFRNETREKRMSMGHLKEDFILDATFAGVTLNVSSDTLFKTFTNIDYGNCYTMESSNLIAWSSGPAYGLRVTLNLEIDEYINNLSSAYGVRLVIHRPGTYPLPVNEGLTLNPGTETYIGLRKVLVQRMGSPYGQCSDGKGFEEQYDFKYSSAACFEFCRTRAIIASCGCIPATGPDLDLNTTAMRICEHGEQSNNYTDQKCMLAVAFRLNSQSSTECDCASPCSQDSYETTLSSRNWPKFDFMVSYLLADICDEDHSSLGACDLIYGKVPATEFNTYKENFLSFVIYFEDLNYETLAEEPEYSGVRFLSDIGGAMGLFMGASVLTYVELLQLMLETLLFCRNKYRANQNRVTKVNVLKNEPRIEDPQKKL